MMVGTDSRVKGFGLWAWGFEEQQIDCCPCSSDKKQDGASAGNRTNVSRYGHPLT